MMRWYAAGLVLAGETIGMGIERMPADPTAGWLMFSAGAAGALWFAWRVGCFR